LQSKRGEQKRIGHRAPSRPAEKGEKRRERGGLVWEAVNPRVREGSLGSSKEKGGESRNVDHFCGRGRKKEPSLPLRKRGGGG